MGPDVENCKAQQKKVLDHGIVRLVDHMGNDLSIVRSARTSYNAEWRKPTEANKGDANLIHYLKRNGHNTPFESVTFTFEVEAPIFVIRQWFRHRTQSYNEVSARYTQLPNTFYIPDVSQITTQSSDNKQMRTHNINRQAEAIQAQIRLCCEVAFETYEAMLLRGCPRELARCVLPVGTYSHFFTTLNLHNLFGFLSERLHEHAQYEIMVYAQAMLELITPIVPVAVEAFKRYQLKGDGYEKILS